MTTTLTDENLAEFIQPILDKAQESFVKSLGEEHEKLSEKVLAKAVAAAKAVLEEDSDQSTDTGDSPPEDWNDLEKVEARAKELQKAKRTEVDLDNIEAVEAHLAKLKESAKEDSEEDEVPEELAKARDRVAELEKELGKSNQTPGETLIKAQNVGEAERAGHVETIVGSINAKRFPAATGGN